MAVQRRLIVAVFNERSSAKSAIEQLYNAGVSSDRISYSGEKAGTARGGFVESIKNLFGGTHTHTPTDVMQDLSNMGLSEDEAQYYAQEYATGRTIVAVHPDEQSQDVLTILQNSGGYHFHSPEGTGPAAHPSTETSINNNLPDYTQAGTDGRPAGYDVNQTTVGERQTVEAGSSGSNPDISRPDYTGQPSAPSVAPEASSIYTQDVNAPAESTTPSSNIPPRSAENYGQADVLRSNGTYEQNVGQPDYSNQQGYNEPGPTLPQDRAEKIERTEGVTDKSEQVTSPTHPDGPAGPYSQGIKSTLETPNVPQEPYNREVKRTSEPHPNHDYSREQRESLHQEDI